MFDEKYQVFLADDAEARHIHYRLRYRIYCEERCFEPPDLFPNRLERDKADSHASHFLVQSRETGHWVATMRLVLPGPLPFPIQTSCALDPRATAALPWTRCAEISRVGVVRNNSASGRFTPADGGGRSRLLNPGVPEIMFGLFRAACRHGQAHGLRHGLWMSTPSLVRLLKRFDLPMRPLGQPCEHRGTRQPHLIDVEDFWNSLARVTARLDPEFHTRCGYASWSEAEAPLAAGPRSGEPPGTLPLSMDDSLRGRVVA